MKKNQNLNLKSFETPHLIMLWSIRSQAISQNQDRVRRPHVDIAKGCLDFNPLGWSRDCTDKQPLETRIHVVVDDDDDDNDGAVTFASDADHDAFAIQDASDFSSSSRKSAGLLNPWHHIDIINSAMKTHWLISILKAKERFEAILHTFQDVTARVFQGLQWIVFVPQWGR